MLFATEQFDPTSFEKYLTNISCHMSAEDKDVSDPMVIDERIGQKEQNIWILMRFL